MRPQRQKSYHQRKHFKKKRKHDGPLPFDVMLRQFKKRCERAGIIAEVRKREYYEKPSQRRQRKRERRRGSGGRWGEPAERDTREGGMKRRAACSTRQTSAQRERETEREDREREG